MSEDNSWVKYVVVAIILLIALIAILALLGVIDLSNIQIGRVGGGGGGVVIVQPAGAQPQAGPDYSWLGWLLIPIIIIPILFKFRKRIFRKRLVPPKGKAPPGEALEEVSPVTPPPEVPPAKEEKLSEESAEETEWYKKGIKYAANEQYDEAIECFDSVLKINEKNKRALYGKARALTKQKNYSGAISFFEKVLEVDNEDAYAWHNKGICHIELGEFDLAIQCFDNARRFGRRDVYVFYNEGVALLTQGTELDDALSCFEEAVKLSKKKHASAYEGIGDIFVRQGKLKEAVKNYESAAKLFKKEKNAQREAAVLEKIKNANSAILTSEFEALVKKADELVKVQQIGKHKAAIKLYEKALGMKSVVPAQLYPQTHYKLGIALIGLNNYKEALESFKEAEEKFKIVGDTDNAEKSAEFVKKCEGQLKKPGKVLLPAPRPPTYADAEMYYNSGKSNEALKCAETILANNPRDAKTHNLAGVIYLQIYFYNEAHEHFKAATSIDGNYTDAWYNWGLNFIKRKEWGKANECFDKVIDIDARYASAYYEKAIALQKLKAPLADVIKSLKKYHACVLNKNPDEAKRVEKEIKKLEKKLPPQPPATPSPTKQPKMQPVLPPMPPPQRPVVIAPLKTSPVPPPTPPQRRPKIIAPSKTSLLDRYLDNAFKFLKEGNDQAANIQSDLAIKRNNESEAAWLYKGCALHNLGKDAEAIKCFEKAMGFAKKNNNASVETQAKQWLAQIKS